MQALLITTGQLTGALAYRPGPQPSPLLSCTLVLEIEKMYICVTHGDRTTKFWRVVQYIV